MGKFTEQMEKWSGNFGREYTDRKPFPCKNWRFSIRGFSALLAPK